MKYLKTFENIDSTNESEGQKILKDCERYFIESGHDTQDTVILLKDAEEAINKWIDDNVE
jgi:hypothetical protein